MGRLGLSAAIFFALGLLVGFTLCLTWHALASLPSSLMASITTYTTTTAAVITSQTQTYSQENKDNQTSVLASLFSHVTQDKHNINNNVSHNIYNQTTIRLDEILTPLAQQVYPGFVIGSDRRLHAFLSNPSMVRDSQTQQVIVGVRISKPSRTGFQSLLLLCHLADPLSASHCQDSGINPSDIPLSCRVDHYNAPIRPTPRFAINNGPEDARLFIDDKGNLGATFTMRGCHPHTEFNESSPSYGMGTAYWGRIPLLPKGNGSADGGGFLWKLQKGPYVFDVRQADGSVHHNNYQVMTKNWISIPPQTFPTTSVNDLGLFKLCVGWTPEMSKNVVYQVSNVVEETATFEVRPQQTETIYTVDHVAYRGSTNFVPLRQGGVLLSLWHTKVKDVYWHYWHLMCPNEPYKMLSTSGLFRFDHNSNVQFAMGLVVEGEYAYAAWSSNDRSSFISRYRITNILEQLKNESGVVPGHAFDPIQQSVAERCRQ